MLAIVAMLVCLFAISVSAKEYNPTSYAELKAAFEEIGESEEEHVINLSGSYTDGSESSGFPVTSNGKITINLNDNTNVGCRFNITGETRLVFQLNGYAMKNTSSRGGDVGCQFLMNNANAHVEAYNGTIEINDVCFWFYNGHINCQGVNIKANEEVIWTDGLGGVGTITFNNCKTEARSDTFMLRAGSCSQKNTRVFTLTNSTFSAVGGGAINTVVQCPAQGSVIKDCTFVGTFKIDSWCQHYGKKTNDMVIENITATTFSPINGMEYYTIRNSKFDNLVLYADSAGEVYLTLWDCDFTNVSWDGNNSYKTKSVATAYTSANCENAGSKVVYAYNAEPAIDEQYALDNPALGHNNQTVVEYPNGYMKAGYVRVGCTKCSNYQEETLNALFECQGYSASTTGDAGIAVGYKVDNVAVDKYTELTGKELSYGVFAVAQSKLGDSNIFDENGNAAIGSIVADLTEYNFTSFELKIAGFKEDKKDALLALGAYVELTDGVTTEYSYMQADDKGEKTGNYYFVSYNDIVK